MVMTGDRTAALAIFLAVAVSLPLATAKGAATPASPQTGAASQPARRAPATIEPAAPAAPPVVAAPVAAAEPATVISPLIERYMLDELKALRTELQGTRLEMVREITDRELKVAENVSSVANNTVTFFFYVFAGLSALFGIWGWQSIRDLKTSVRTAAEAEIARLSDEYETRLTRLEEDLQSKASIILDNQREIERTQTIQGLWLQANQSPDPRSKVEVYDRILELAPGDPETMTYKADAALELGEYDWALSLCNRILEDNPSNSQAMFQRASAKTGLGEYDSAMADLEEAIALAPALRERARDNEAFEALAARDDFKALVPTGDDRPSLV